MKIRSAEIEDTEQLDHLLEELIHDEVQYDKNINCHCKITDNYCHQIGLDGHKILLAESEGEMIGYLYGFIYQVPEICLKPVAILDALYVKEAYRNKGCAKAQLREFRKFSEENGACRIELKVLSDNNMATKLYEKIGFIETKNI